MLDGFLNWLSLQVTGVGRQVHLNKNQVQQLLLGTALLLSNMDFACWTDTSETQIPDFLANSCMKKEDTGAISKIVNKLFKVVSDHLK